MRFKPHLPASMDIERPAEFTVATQEELLAHPLVRKFAEQDGFTRFSVSSDHPPLLIAEYGKKTWWVVGYIQEGDVDLPERK